MVAHIATFNTLPADVDPDAAALLRKTVRDTPGFVAGYYLGRPGRKSITIFEDADAGPGSRQSATSAPRVNGLGSSPTTSSSSEPNPSRPLPAPFRRRATMLSAGQHTGSEYQAHFPPAACRQRCLRLKLAPGAAPWPDRPAYQRRTSQPGSHRATREGRGAPVLSSCRRSSCNNAARSALRKSRFAAALWRPDSLPASDQSA